MDKPYSQHIIKNAAGPKFDILGAHDGYALMYVDGGLFRRVAQVREQGTSLEVEEHPSLSGMPKRVIEESRLAMSRIIANDRFYSCEPDGRGPYD